MSTDASFLVSIGAFLVFLVLEAFVLAGATRLALRILKIEGPAFRKLLVGGLAQMGAVGFCVVVVAQAIQLATLPGIILILFILLLVGLAEIRRNLPGSWKQLLAPWSLSSLLQLLLGLPAAFIFYQLVVAALNILFPLSS